jgi:hypothetical protein
MDKPAAVTLLPEGTMAKHAPALWLARCSGALLLVSLASHWGSPAHTSCSTASYGGLPLCSERSLGLLDRSLEAEFLVAAIKHGPIASMIGRQFMQAHEHCGKDAQCLVALKAATTRQLDAVFGSAPVGPTS